MAVADSERDAVFLELKRLDPKNNFCIDCNKKDPDWASATLGVFLCIGCCGVHRAWGTHISFTRSCLLDDWTCVQLAVMRAGGNSKMQKFLEMQNFPSTLSMQQRYCSPIFDLYRGRLAGGRNVLEIDKIGYLEPVPVSLPVSGIEGWGSDSMPPIDSPLRVLSEGSKLATSPKPHFVSNDATVGEQKVFGFMLLFGLFIQFVCGLFPDLLGLSMGFPARVAIFLAAFYFVGAEMFFRSSDAKAVGDVQQLALNTIGQTVCRIAPLSGVVFHLPFSYPSLQTSFVTSSPFLIIMLLATVLRWRAIVVMGHNFQLSLQVNERQHVTKIGPYAYVRHPGYLGNGLMFVATGIVISGSFFIGWICLLAFAIAWHPRMKDEEIMLSRSLPEYVPYSKQVRYRLIPFIY